MAPTYFASPSLTRSTFSTPRHHAGQSSEWKMRSQTCACGASKRQIVMNLYSAMALDKKSVNQSVQRTIENSPAIYRWDYSSPSSVAGLHIKRFAHGRISPDAPNLRIKVVMDQSVTPKEGHAQLNWQRLLCYQTVATLEA